MRIKRITLISFITIIYIGIIMVGIGLFVDWEPSSVTENMEEQEMMSDAKYYELENIRLEGEYVIGIWKNEVGEEQRIKAKLPSAGSGILHDGGKVSLQSYETPDEDGILSNCFYWNGFWG